MTASTSRSILLSTKLERPPLPRDLVVRPRLLVRLDAGLARKLVVVSAPAGFGKTTPVASWLATLEVPGDPSALPSFAACAACAPQRLALPRCHRRYPARVPRLCDPGRARRLSRPAIAYGAPAGATIRAAPGVCRQLLAQGRAVDLVEADSLLQKVQTLHAQRHDRRRLIEVHALRALWHQACRDTDQALHALAKSVHLAEHGQFVRIYVDEGPAMAGLLQQLQQQVRHTTYLGDTRTLDVHICMLRRYTELDAHAPRYLVTSRNSGYKFDPQGEQRVQP